MKKNLLIAMFIIVLLGTGMVYAEAPAYSLTMDGIPMDSAVQGRVMGDAEYHILYVPLRPVAESVGMTVNWLPSSGEVSISGSNETTFVPTQDEPDCWCAEPPLLIDGRVWVSGNFLAREFAILMAVQDQNITLQTGTVQWVDVPAGSYKLVLDVRNTDEFAAGHLTGAVLIPVAQLVDRLSELEKYRNEPILIYCKKGARSVQAAVLLRKYGFENVCILKDGYDGWNAANTH